MYAFLFHNSNYILERRGESKIKLGKLNRL